MRNGKKSRTLVRACILIFWLLLWQAAACLVHNTILLAGPVQVLVRLGEELTKRSFYQAVLGTLFRILAGFFSGFAAGIIIGSFSVRYRFLHLVLEPVIAAMKSIPVAAFVVLVLIWSGSKYLAIPISFLVVFPHVYINTRTGLLQTDEKMLRMADCYKMNIMNQILFLYRPALMPHLTSAAKITMGMSFKSGIAAEVIGIPEYSIGGNIYLSKIYLDTSGVLAWTVVVLILSSLCEHGIVLLLEMFGRKRCKPICGKRKNEALSMKLEAMEKRYESGVCIKTPYMEITENGRYGIMGSSGCGKTTWLEMIAGLKQVHPACLFQEDRLCMECSATDNVRMTCNAAWQEEIVPALLKLLPREAIDKPVSELSGGMKRRVALVRACLSGGNLLLLDEPFTGLDDENRKKAAEFILEYQRGRALLFTTHQKSDLELLHATDVIFR